MSFISSLLSPPSNGNETDHLTRTLRVRKMQTKILPRVAKNKATATRIQKIMYVRNVIEGQSVLLEQYLYGRSHFY